MKKIKYFIPSFIIMILIFYFSQQTGSESSGLSTSVLLWLQNHFHIFIPSLIIRKIAHMCEYALLVTSFFYAFYKGHFSKINLYSFICSFLYACFDEFHQLFIDGRAGQFNDVIIDSCGALIMLIILSIIFKKKENDNSSSLNTK